MKIIEARVTNPTEKSYLGVNDYCLKYYSATNEFSIRILTIDSKSDSQKYLKFMKADVYTSSDFRQMMNIENDELFKSIASLSVRRNREV